METIYVDNNNVINTQTCVATVGFFDGVHAGHQYLLHELKKNAANLTIASAVVTFLQHPNHVLQKTNFPPLLTTFSEKIALIEKIGIDFCFVLDFTNELARKSAEEFIKLLKNQLNVSNLLIGYDHRFGHNREENFSDYLAYGQKIGVELVQAEAYEEDKGLQISSSNIRHALMNGNIETANKMLSYQYSLSGKVIDGYKIGRKIGFPTANIEPTDQEKLVPKKGVYAVKVVYKDKKYRAMMNIGQSPTIKNNASISLEVNIIDFDSEIYDEEIRISFVKKIRDEIKFNTVDELIAQIKNDRKIIVNLDKSLFF